MSRRVNVNALRTSMGLSIEQLAERLGVHARTVSRWENAHTDPSPLALKQLRELQAPDDRTSGDGPRRLPALIDVQRDNRESES